MLLALLKKGVKERVEFFNVHVTSTFVIYFFKSLLYKSSHTISWILCNLCHIYNISPFFMSRNVFGY